MSIRKLRVGLIGAGAIARDQHLPGWSKVPFTEVVAYADTADDARAKTAPLLPHARDFVDWHDLLDQVDLDIVDVCTPTQTHAEITVAALEKGIHVLCEKPLATTSAEVARIEAAAQKSGKLAMAAQHFRFEASSRRLKALIDGGLVGPIYYARAQWLRRRLLPARPTFTQRALSGGGPGMDIGVHVLDLAYWFMGAPEPVSVSAVTSDRLIHRKDLAGEWGDWNRETIDVEDFAAGFIRFADGAALTLEVSWLLLQPERETIRLQCYGERAGLVWPDGVLAGETNREPWDLSPHLPDKVPGHHEEIRQFALAVRDGLPAPVPLEQTFQVTRILEALYRSSATGHEVRL